MAPAKTFHYINKPELFVSAQGEFEQTIWQASLMTTISFMSANFVARELGYHMTGGWGQGDDATNQVFAPLETYRERFEAMLKEVSSLGFRAMDLWVAHLNPAWATARHIEIAVELLRKYDLTVPSLAYWLSDDIGTLKKVAEIANAVGTKIIGAGCMPSLLTSKRREFVGLLEKHDLRFGFENHPEKTAAEVIARIGDSEGGRIGVAADTGWFGTQGFDAANALEQLGDRLIHVHLKDVVRPASADAPDIREGAGKALTLKDVGHETCALGDGVVPIKRCVEVLKKIGYKGAIAIEHEPEDRSPIEDVRLSYSRIKEWISA